MNNTVIFCYISLFIVCYTSYSSSIDPVKLTRASSSSSSSSSSPSSSLSSQKSKVKVPSGGWMSEKKEEKNVNIPPVNHLHYGKRILPSNSVILINNSNRATATAAAAATTNRRSDFEDFDDDDLTSGPMREKAVAPQVAPSVARSRQWLQSKFNSHSGTGDLQPSSSYSKPSGHQGFFQYARMPAEGAWEFGYRRGNHEHFTERHEHGASHHFKSKVRWGDKHGGYGEHYFDFNHKGTGDDPHVLQRNQQIKSHFTNPNYYAASSAIVTTNSGN